MDLFLREPLIVLKTPEGPDDGWRGGQRKAAERARTGQHLRRSSKRLVRCETRRRAVFAFIPPRELHGPALAGRKGYFSLDRWEACKTVKAVIKISPRTGSDAIHMVVSLTRGTCTSSQLLALWCLISRCSVFLPQSLFLVDPPPDFLTFFSLNILHVFMCNKHTHKVHLYVQPLHVTQKKSGSIGSVR